MSEAGLDLQFGVGNWAATPRFCITQASGSKRAIDDGRRGGQNRETEDDEKLVLCTALQPAHVARALHQRAVAQGVSLIERADALESGDEDIPDACRTAPCAPADLRYNVTAFKDPESGQLAFQPMWSFMFSLSSAVKCFNRWSNSSSCW